MSKAKKQRADKYEKPLHIEGTFDAVIGVAMGKKIEGNNQQKEMNKMNDKIEAGDVVTHKVRTGLNGGTGFNVLKVEGNQATCWIIDEKGINQDAVFNINDLVIKHKRKG